MRLLATMTRPTTIWCLVCCSSLLMSLLAPVAKADIVVENDLIDPKEIYDFVALQDSEHWWMSGNVTKYYCIMRGLWNPQNHPAEFPQLARFSNPLMYSSTKQFLPWLRNRATTYGVEKVAESGFTDTFHKEIEGAGRLVDDVQEGRGFFVDKDDYEQNYAYMPGIRVNPDYPFLSGIVSMNPSPDWFTGFYLLDVVDEYDRTYWNRIVIHTYPWDAGTDGGTTYTDVDYDLDPTINVERIYAKNALPNGIFLSPAGDEVLPVAEWDCALHVCNSSDDCEMENWPPANGCDKLKWPGCDDVCNPDAGDACEECKPKRTQRRSEPDASETAGAAEGEAQEKIFYKSCCQSNHEPLTGSCKGNYGGGSGAATAGIALSSSLAILSVVVTTIAYLGIM